MNKPQTLEELKKEFEARFFNGREVEALAATYDMWDFIQSALQQAREEAVEDFIKWHNELVERIPVANDLQEALRSARFISPNAVKFYLKALKSQPVKGGEDEA